MDLTFKINQSVAILIDGNNIEMSLHSLTNNPNAMLNFDNVIPRLLNGRGLNRLIYFREGKSISSKLAERLHTNYHGSVVPCYKSADIPLTIKATQIAQKVDTIIILSGDADYVELVKHLKGEGVRVEIAAVPETTARILLGEADHFTAITKEDAFMLKAPIRQAKPAEKTEKPKDAAKPASRGNTNKRSSSPKKTSNTAKPANKRTNSSAAKPKANQQAKTNSKAKSNLKQKANQQPKTNQKPKSSQSAKSNQGRSNQAKPKGKTKPTNSPTKKRTRPAKK